MDDLNKEPKNVIDRIDARLEALQKEIGHEYPDVEITKAVMYGYGGIGADPARCIDERLKRLIENIILEEKD